MRILLTGGTGYLGKRFVEKFYADNEIIIFGRNSSMKDCYFFKSKNIILENGLIEENTIFDLVKKYQPDVIIHLAALSGLKNCEENPFNAFITNVFGTYNVARSCLLEKSKLIFLSSREVYGETQGNASFENDSLLPVNVYGMTKMLAENIIENLGTRQNLDYVIFRVTNVYGPGGERRGVNRIIDSVINKNFLQINGGNQTLNLIYVDDLIEIIHNIISNKKISKQIFNIGSNDTISINEFCKIIEKLVQKNLTIEYLPKIDYEVTFFKPDIQKLDKILEFPKTSLIEGLKKTLSQSRLEK